MWYLVPCDLATLRLTYLLLSAFIACSLHTRLPSAFLRSFDFPVTASGGTIEPGCLLRSFSPGLEADGTADRASVFAASRISPTSAIWPITPIAPVAPVAPVAPRQEGNSAWQTVHEFEGREEERGMRNFV